MQSFKEKIFNRMVLLMIGLGISIVLLGAAILAPWGPVSLFRSHGSADSTAAGTTNATPVPDVPVSVRMDTFSSMIKIDIGFANGTVHSVSRVNLLAKEETQLGSFELQPYRLFTFYYFPCGVSRFQWPDEMVVYLDDPLPGDFNAPGGKYKPPLLLNITSPEEGRNKMIMLVHICPPTR